MRSISAREESDAPLELSKLRNHKYWSLHEERELKKQAKLPKRMEGRRLKRIRAVVHLA